MRDYLFIIREGGRWGGGGSWIGPYIIIEVDDNSLVREVSSLSRTARIYYTFTHVVGAAALARDISREFACKYMVPNNFFSVIQFGQTRIFARAHSRKNKNLIITYRLSTTIYD